MASRQEQLQLLAQESERLGQPGAKALLAQAKRKKWTHIKPADVRELIAVQGAKAALRPLPRAQGKTATGELGVRAMVDLIDFKTKPVEGNSVIVVMLEQFSRRLFAAPATGKEPRVIKPVLEKLMREWDNYYDGPVKVISTDAGNEFGGVVDLSLIHISEPTRPY